MESVSLYSEARNEYMKQLSTWLCSPLVEFYRKEYTICGARAGKRVMAEFQDFCATVPLWNQDVIDTNVNIILDNCRCDYIEELMTAVFIAHTKMLTAIRINTKQQKLQITLPKLDHFLHRVFIECARSFWKVPFLFSDEYTPIERQKNLLQAESMVVEALAGAVRSLLPIKNILRDYLENDETESQEEKDEQKSTLVQSNNLETVETKVDNQDKVETTKDNQQKVETKVDNQEKVETKVDNQQKVETKVDNQEKVETTVDNREKVETTVDNQEKIEIKEEKTVESKFQSKEHVDTSLKSTSQQTEPNNDSEPKDIKLISLESIDNTKEFTLPTDDTAKVQSVVDATGMMLNIPTEPVSKSSVLDLEKVEERSVHFNPYDTVFSLDSQKEPELRYVDKETLETDNSVPKLTISETSTNLSGVDIEDLENKDIDIALGTTSDFEVLA